MLIDLSVHQHSILIIKDDKLSHIRHGLYQHTSQYEIYCADLWYWVNTNFLWLCCSGFWYCHFKKIFCLTSKRYFFSYDSSLFTYIVTSCICSYLLQLGSTVLAAVPRTSRGSISLNTSLWNSFVKFSFLIDLVECFCFDYNIL